MGARFWAIMVDLIVLGVCLFGVMTLLEWAFSNFGTTAKGIFELLFVLIFYSAPFFINWVAFTFDKQTPGQFVLQFRVIRLEGETAVFRKRVFHGFSFLLSANEKNGVFSWDRKSGTRAISTRHAD